MKMQQTIRSFVVVNTVLLKVTEFKYFYSLDSAKCIMLVYKVKANPIL